MPDSAIRAKKRSVSSGGNDREYVFPDASCFTLLEAAAVTVVAVTIRKEGGFYAALYRGSRDEGLLSLENITYNSKKMEFRPTKARLFYDVHENTGAENILACMSCERSYRITEDNVLVLPGFFSYNSLVQALEKAASTGFKKEPKLPESDS